MKKISLLTGLIITTRLLLIFIPEQALSAYDLCDIQKQDALISAAFEGNLPRVKKLVRKHLFSRISFLVATQNKEGITPLLAASASGNDDLVIYLLEHRTLCTLNLADNKGITPLLAASASAQANTVRLLLEKGADITAANKKGQTALLIGAERRYPKLVKFLLQHKADPFVEDFLGNTALDFAARNNGLLTARLLLEAGVKADNNAGQKLLKAAIKQNDGKTKKMLLQAGAKAYSREERSL